MFTNLGSFYRVRVFSPPGVLIFSRSKFSRTPTLLLDQSLLKGRVRSWENRNSVRKCMTNRCKSVHGQLEDVGSCSRWQFHAAFAVRKQDTLLYLWTPINNCLEISEEVWSNCQQLVILSYCKLETGGNSKASSVQRLQDPPEEEGNSPLLSYIV